MLTTILDVISSYGPEIHGDDPEATADEWRDAGFSNLSSDVVSAWCDAYCFEPSAARRLHDAGITPKDAATVVAEWRGQSGNTIAYWVSNNDMSIAQAQAILSEGQG